MHLQRQDALERLQRNLKEEYRAAVDYEVAFFNTVSARCQVRSVRSSNGLPSAALFKELDGRGKGMPPLAKASSACQSGACARLGRRCGTD